MLNVENLKRVHHKIILKISINKQIFEHVYRDKTVFADHSIHHTSVRVLFVNQTALRNKNLHNPQQRGNLINTTNSTVVNEGSRAILNSII